jgi:hypothetical protein
MSVNSAARAAPSAAGEVDADELGRGASGAGGERGGRGGVGPQRTVRAIGGLGGEQGHVGRGLRQRERDVGRLREHFRQARVALLERRQGHLVGLRVPRRELEQTVAQVGRLGTRAAGAAPALRARGRLGHERRRERCRDAGHPARRRHDRV